MRQVIAQRPQTTGSDVLRDTLKARISGANAPSLHKIAADLNDDIDLAAKRITAREIAARMAPNADEATVGRLAQNMVYTLPDTPAETSAADLQSFIDQRQALSPRVLSALANLLFAGADYDPVTDKLTRPEMPVQAFTPPPVAVGDPDFVERSRNAPRLTLTDAPPTNKPAWTAAPGWASR